MNATPEQVEAGHAFYTKRALALYDVAILGDFSRAAWKCPSRRILQHYNEHISINHLDVGVGSGYFLDRCRFESPSPRVALMDLNTNCLEVASRRIGRFNPEVYRANVLEPIDIDAPKFDSIGLNYVLHCLPGDMAAKGVAFEYLKALVNPAVPAPHRLDGPGRRLCRHLRRQAGCARVLRDVLRMGEVGCGGVRARSSLPNSERVQRARRRARERRPSGGRAFGLYRGLSWTMQGVGEVRLTCTSAR